MHQFFFSGRRGYILPVDYPGLERACCSYSSNDVSSHQPQDSCKLWSLGHSDLIQLLWFALTNNSLLWGWGQEVFNPAMTQAQPSGVVTNKEDTLNYTSLWLKVLIEPNTVAQICVWDFIAKTSLKQWEKKLSTISEQNNSSLSGHSSSMKPGMLRNVICQNLKFQSTFLPVLN